jgi:hypothetical protein
MKASQRIGALMLKALEEQFGDKMTLAERRAVTMKLIETSFAQAKPNAGSSSGGAVGQRGRRADSVDVRREVAGASGFVERRSG